MGTRRNEELKKPEEDTASAKTALEAKSKLLRAYKRAMRSKLRKIKKVLWSKAQGNNKVWLRKALKKCHASEIGLHNKWVKCTHKSKMSLELCRRAGKVALTMEKSLCSYANPIRAVQACFQGCSRYVQAHQQAPRDPRCSGCTRR